LEESLGELKEAARKMEEDHREEATLHQHQLVRRRERTKTNIDIIMYTVSASECVVT